jgi:DNA-binding response OmpR family regulator
MRAHILVVEDTKSLAESIADLLRMEDFDVSLVVNGEMAIDFLANNSADLIITDLVMPRMNGIEFIEHIRSDQRFALLPVILLTAQTGPQNRLTAEKVGANAFLEKPFDEEELLISIRGLISR